PEPPPPNTTLFPYTTLFRSNEQPMSVNGRMPVITTAKRRSQFTRRRDICVAIQNVSNLVRIFLSYASQGQSCESLRRCRIEFTRSEEHTSELQSRFDLVCRL